MTRRTPRLLPLAALAFLAGCITPEVAYNPRANFAAVKRVAVVTFAGPQGDVAADMMTTSLLARGADVIERQQLNQVLQEQHLASSGLLDPATVKEVGKILGVDALFVGTVVESMPAQSYMVQSAPGAIMGGVTPVGNGDVFSEGPVLGVPDSQVVTSAATVSLVSRMVDVQTGSIMWSASMSYDGFDVGTAMQAVTDSFAQSLVPIWPELIAPKS